jgi:type IV fimbrial biogenesis protein FimT
MYKMKGFTLTDLLLGLAIIATTTGLAIPSFKNFIHNQQIISSTNQMVGQIQMTRTMALESGFPMTLCATINGIKCIRDWKKSHMVFHDANNNLTRDIDERLIYLFDPFAEETTLTWRAFQNKRQLVYSPSGSTAAQNGTFRICSKIEPKFNKAIIINYSGRPRLSKDKNGDGYHEDRKGKPITCS